MAMALPVSAQQQGENAGGLLATLRFDTTLRDDEDGAFIRNRLDFSLRSETRREYFTFDIGGAYDLKLSGTRETQLDQPRLGLSYGRVAQSASFEIDASFQRNDIEDVVIDDPDDGLGLIIEDGRREDFSIGTQLEWGRDALFGGEASLRYSGQRFLDTTSPTLFDNDTVRANLRFNFRFDERITVFTDLRYREIDRDGGTDSEIASVNVGTDLEITPTLTGEFRLGYSSTQESGPDADPDREGFTANASLEQSLQNGTLTGTFSSALGENGRQTDVRIARALELRDGSFNASLGYGRRSGEGRALFSLGYTRENPRNSISFDLGQSFSSSTTGSAVLNSSLRVNYNQRLSERTGYELGLTLRESDPVLATDVGTKQLTVNFSVNHTLTERWSLVGGYTHTRQRSDGGTTTTDDEFFVGLSSVLSWRP